LQRVDAEIDAWYCKFFVFFLLSFLFLLFILSFLLLLSFCLTGWFMIQNKHLAPRSADFVHFALHSSNALAFAVQSYTLI
jgi:hypothetical protein